MTPSPAETAPEALPHDLQTVRPSTAGLHSRAQAGRVHTRRFDQRSISRLQLVMVDTPEVGEREVRPVSWCIAWIHVCASTHRGAQTTNAIDSFGEQFEAIAASC